jgi:mRNA interferase MazF
MTRGEVWLVSFTPTVGDEIQKTRPAVLVSDDSIGMLELRVVVPITAWQPAFASFPWMVRLEPDARNGLSKASAADAFQVKSVSTRRLLRRLGSLTAEELEAVVEAVGVVIDHP